MWPWRRRLVSACRSCAHSTLRTGDTAGQAQCAYAAHACARNMLCPSRAVARFAVRTLAAPALQHAVPRPCCGPSQFTYARRPCAHNILHPSRAAAQFNVLTLAVPALTACCARAMLLYLRSPILRPQHTAPGQRCSPSQRTCAWSAVLREFLYFNGLL
jgi:hypothetical protein